MFSALSIEARTNRLDRESISKRRLASLRYKIGKAEGEKGANEEPKFITSQNRYKSINLSSNVLQDDVLAEMLFDGRFVAENIKKSLDASQYFIERAKADAWNVVIHFDEIDDEDVNAALIRMNDQFDRRLITNSGELLHVVALKMMMAMHHVTDETPASVRDDSKRYIDDLLEKGTLPPREAGYRWFDSFRDSYSGFGYWVDDDYRKEFNEVYEYLIGRRSVAIESEYPKMIREILDSMRENGQSFYENICYTNNGSKIYADVPILAKIPAHDFVDAWLASPKSGWYWIGNALNERRKITRQNSSFAAEKIWCQDVFDELMRRASESPGLARVRILRAARPVCAPEEPSAMDEDISDVS